MVKISDLYVRIKNERRVKEGEKGGGVGGRAKLLVT